MRWGRPLRLQAAVEAPNPDLVGEARERRTISCVIEFVCVQAAWRQSWRMVPARTACMGMASWSHFLPGDLVLDLRTYRHVHRAVLVLFLVRRRPRSRCCRLKLANRYPNYQR